MIDRGHVYTPPPGNHPVYDDDDNDDVSTADVHWPNWQDIDCRPREDDLVNIQQMIDQGRYEVVIEGKDTACGMQRDLAPATCTYVEIGHNDSVDFVEVIVDLKLQLANHKTEIDMLKARLTRCTLENKILLAERATLVEEIALHKKQSDELLSSSNPSLPSLRDKILPIRSRKQQRNGSMEMLLQSNSQLLLQNANLQIDNDALRKTLEANILGNIQKRREDEEAINGLLHENKQMRAELAAAEKTTTTESLSASSTMKQAMPEHWPNLNDPCVDDTARDMTSHASEAWEQRRIRRLKRMDRDATSDAVQTMWSVLLNPPNPLNPQSSSVSVSEPPRGDQHEYVSVQEVVRAPNFQTNNADNDDYGYYYDDQFPQNFDERTSDDNNPFGNTELVPDLFTGHDLSCKRWNKVFRRHSDRY